LSALEKIEPAAIDLFARVAAKRLAVARARVAVSGGARPPQEDETAPRPARRALRMKLSQSERAYGH
jgi:hypothetical protein